GRPYRSTAARPRRSTASGSRTSTGTGCTSAPSPPRRPACVASSASLMSAMTTDMPSATNASTIARPMPLAAPVTTAVRPSSCSIAREPTVAPAHAPRGRARLLPFGSAQAEMAVARRVEALLAQPRPADLAGLVAQRRGDELARIGQLVARQPRGQEGGELGRFREVVPRCDLDDGVGLGAQVGV